MAGCRRTRRGPAAPSLTPRSRRSRGQERAGGRAGRWARVGAGAPLSLPRSETSAPTARERAALPWKRRGRRGGAWGGLSGSRDPAHARAFRKPCLWAAAPGLRPCARQDVEAELGKPVTAPGSQLPRAATREGSGGGVEPSSVGLRAELRRGAGGWTVAAALWGLPPRWPALTVPRRRPPPCRGRCRRRVAAGRPGSMARSCPGSRHPAGAPPAGARPLRAPALWDVEARPLMGT